jgi:hypothetical protein
LARLFSLKDQLLILGAAIASVFVVNKIVAFVTAIQGLITIFVALRNTALGAAAAVALATYGTNLVAGGAALLALGITTNTLKNLLSGNDGGGNPNGAYNYPNGSAFTYGGSTGIAELLPGGGAASRRCASSRRWCTQQAECKQLADQQA